MWSAFMLGNYAGMSWQHLFKRRSKSKNERKGLEKEKPALQGAVAKSYPGLSIQKFHSCKAAGFFFGNYCLKSLCHCAKENRGVLLLLSTLQCFLHYCCYVRYSQMHDYPMLLRSFILKETLVTSSSEYCSFLFLNKIPQEICDRPRV